MIVILSPHTIGRGRTEYYKAAWAGFARRHGEEVMSTVRTGENERRLLSDANRTNGRLILVHPCFLPSPTIFEELDYLREQEGYVILLKKYRMYFNPGETSPYKYDRIGLDTSLLVFQLSGQSDFRMPPNVTERWLEKKNSKHIIRLSQEFMGDSERGATMSSLLGHNVLGIGQTGSLVKMGCFGVDGDLDYPRSTQENLWRASLEAFSIWTRLT